MSAQLTQFEEEKKAYQEQVCRLCPIVIRSSFA